MRNAFLVVALLFSSLAAQASSNLVITAEPQRSPDKYYNYDFGAVFVNTRTATDFTLTAEGDEPTEIEGIRISGIEFSGTSNCPKVLQPKQSCVTRVYFWPTRKGFSFSGQLSFYMKAHDIYIRLYGRTFN